MLQDQLIMGAAVDIQQQMGMRMLGYTGFGGGGGSFHAENSLPLLGPHMDRPPPRLARCPSAPADGIPFADLRAVPQQVGSAGSVCSAQMLAQGRAQLLLELERRQATLQRQRLEHHEWCLAAEAVLASRHTQTARQQHSPSTDMLLAAAAAVRAKRRSLDEPLAAPQRRRLTAASLPLPPQPRRLSNSPDFHRQPSQSFVRQEPSRGSRFPDAASLPLPPRRRSPDTQTRPNLSALVAGMQAQLASQVPPSWRKAGAGQQPVPRQPHGPYSPALQPQCQQSMSQWQVQQALDSRTAQIEHALQQAQLIQQAQQAVPQQHPAQMEEQLALAWQCAWPGAAPAGGVQVGMAPAPVAAASPATNAPAPAMRPSDLTSQALPDCPSPDLFSLSDHELLGTPLPPGSAGAPTTVAPDDVLAAQLLDGDWDPSLVLSPLTGLPSDPLVMGNFGATASFAGDQTAPADDDLAAFMPSL